MSASSKNMDNLLCDEEWLMRNNVSTNEIFNSKVNGANSFGSSKKDDYEETFRMFMEKEESFMPKPGYLNLLKFSNFIRTARSESVNWIVKTQRRMNLSNGAVFGAINYLDRFISSTNCELQVWKFGMFELLSMACLSVASKFNQMNTPPLHEFQVDRLDDSFSATMVQKMELTLLESLRWRMDCVTPFSYIELLVQIIDVNKSHVVDLNSRATELLITAVSGGMVLEFRPSVIAISVVKCVLEDLHSPTDNMKCLSTIIPQSYEVDLIKCHKIITDLSKTRHRNYVASCSNSWVGPSSPVTILYHDYGGSRMSSGMKKSASRKRKCDELGCILSRK